jgi:hypothetical protein
LILKVVIFLWTGEPTEAEINITAVYKEAAPIDLVGDQLANVTAYVKTQTKKFLLKPN